MALDSLTYLELLEIANRIYPDGLLSSYFDETTGEPISNPNGGDTLALFVVRELAETFDPDVGRSEQLDEAIRVMERASSDIQAIVSELVRRSLGSGDVSAK